MQLLENIGQKYANGFECQNVYQSNLPVQIWDVPWSVAA